jgi:hypothetical protein
MALQAGTKLGRYEVLSSLGAGGMGEVYRARDEQLGREVAIKVLPEAVAGDAERLARFEREARVLASLNHPNVAHLYGYERDGDTSFIIMELVEGETLADRLARGVLPFEQVVSLFLQIAEGLEAAHEQGVVHRDLKPANIKLGGASDGASTLPSGGRLKILDFGLAKAMAADEAGSPRVGDAAESPTLTLAATQRGEILGTAAYMAPEQARGQPVDKRADIWAFGVCLFEALTGRQAFGADTASDSMAAILTRDPDWSLLPADVATELRGLLIRCLEKDAMHRLRDIGDARIELESLAKSGAGSTGHGVRSAAIADAADAAAAPVGVAPSPAPGSGAPGRRHSLLIAAAVLVALLVGLVVYPRLRATLGEPVVVVMDTTSPVGVYDPVSLAQGETNADDLTEVLSDLPVRVVKENTSPLWRREHQVAQLEPALVVIHVSAFVYPPTFDDGDAFAEFSQGLAAVAGTTYRELLTNKIVAFFGYLAATSDRTRFLVYSRGTFDDPERAKALVDSWVARFPALEGRVWTYSVPHDEQTHAASWRDPETAAGLHARIVEILGLGRGMRLELGSTLGR